MNNPNTFRGGEVPDDWNLDSEDELMKQIHMAAGTEESKKRQEEIIQKSKQMIHPEDWSEKNKVPQERQEEVNPQTEVENIARNNEAESNDSIVNGHERAIDERIDEKAREFRKVISGKDDKWIRERLESAEKISREYTSEERRIDIEGLVKALKEENERRMEMEEENERRMEMEEENERRMESMGRRLGERLRNSKLVRKGIALVLTGMMVFGVVAPVLQGNAYAGTSGGTPIETVANEDELANDGGEVETNIYDAVKEANGYKEVDSSKEIYSPDILDQANNVAGETSETEEEGNINFEVTDENGEKVKESFKRVEGGYNEKDDEYFAEGKSSLGAFTGRHETFGEMVNAAIRSPEQIAMFEAMRGATGSRSMADVNWQANNMAEDADGFDARANDTLEWFKEVMQGGRIESYNIPEGTTRITFYMAKDANTEDSTYIYTTAINGEHAVDAIRLVDGEGNYVLDQYKPALMEMAGIPADQADSFIAVWLKDCNQIALVRVGREAVRQQVGSSTVTRGGEDTTSSSTVNTTTTSSTTVDQEKKVTEEERTTEEKNTTEEEKKTTEEEKKKENPPEEEKKKENPPEEEKHEEDIWTPKPKGPDTHAGNDHQKMEVTNRSEETEGERTVDATYDNMGRPDVAPTFQVDDADSAAIQDNAPQRLEEVESSQEANARTSVNTGYSEDTSTAQPGAVTDTVVDAPNRTIVEEVPESQADAGSVDAPDENLTAAQLAEQLRAAEGQGAEQAEQINQRVPEV